MNKNTNYDIDANGNVVEVPADAPAAQGGGHDYVAEAEQFVDPADFITTITPELQAQMERVTQAANLKSGHFWKWPDGKREADLRILPASRKWSQDGLPFVLAIRHWIPKDQGEGVVPVPCLARTGVGCPLCDVANELKHVLPEEQARRWEAQSQFLYNVIDVNEQPEPGKPFKVMIYGAPRGVHNAIRAALEAQWDLLSPNGHVMRFKKEMKNGNTSYIGSALPTTFHVPMSALGGIHNLVEAASPAFTLADALKVAQVARTRHGIATGAASAALPPMQRRVSLADKNKLAKEL